MAHKLDQIIVVDVESTCWNAAPPRGEENEIIEVGLTLLDVATGQRHGRRSILVRPERSTVSAFCTRLTTLTQAQVDAGGSFAEACAVLSHEYDAGERVLASYGDYDRRMFALQCESRSVPYPFGPTHLNVKNLYALMRGLRHEIGVAQALLLDGLSFEGTQHRGVDDAWNIARLLGNLLRAGRP